MNLEHLDPNHFARQGAFTKQIFRDVYPSIDPTSPAMSQRGKVIVISGAGSGIGASGIVPAFAKAGARAVILVGRRAANIHDTAVNLRQHFPSIQVIEAPIDITESEAIETLHASIEADFGHADVLVNNAGVQSGPAKIAESDDLKWWADFEINTRGTYLITRMFLKLLSTNGHGFIINITSGASTVILPTMSSYGISKLAVNRMTEYVAAESPNVVSITLDPGTVNTDMLPESFRKFALDTPELVGGTAVWLATKEAEFLNGRFVMASWFVDELIARKDEIMGSNDLKMTLHGNFGIN